MTGVSVVSMSWVQDEFKFPDEIKSHDSIFLPPQSLSEITFIASSGDDGSPGKYPAYSPSVLAVGGTKLTSATGSQYQETSWSGSGGGISQMNRNRPFNLRLAFQATTDVRSRMFRLTAIHVPVSMCTTPTMPDFGGSVWQIGGGTSLGAPCWAGLMAIVNQGRQAEPGGAPLDGPSQTLPALYSIAHTVSRPFPRYLER